MRLLRISPLPAFVILITPMIFAQEVILPGQATRGRAPEVVGAVNNSYIVTFAPGTSKLTRGMAALQAGAQIRHNYDNVDAISVTANSNAVNSLRSNRGVIRVIQDSVHHGRVKPGTGGGGGGSGPMTFDTRQLISEGVQRVGMPKSGSDGAGIGVALLDSGIDFAHPDLAPAPNSAATAYNALTPGASCQDDGGHGTHLSGLIAALNNEIGIVGVAPAAKLYCVKVLDSTISGPDSAIMAGLDWVLTNRNRVSPRIRVVNISFGRPLGPDETLDNSPLRPLIQALYNAGIVVVAAAGNNPSVTVNQIIPAGFPEVLSVASTIASNGIRTCFLFGMDLPSVPADTASGFTTDGTGVTISAPGEERSDIVQLGSAGCVGLQYGTLSTTLQVGGVSRKLVPGLQEARGSSFSAALVSGIVARIMQNNLTPATSNGAEVEGIRTYIRNHASQTGIAPLNHPWAGVVYDYSFDGVREGIAQAP
jgi:subtilisin family serine protease